MRALLFVLSLMILQACTKEKEVPRTEDGKPMLTRNSSDPEAVIIEAEIGVPSKFLSKVKKTDLLMWDIKDENGSIVALGIGPVPKLPHKVVVRAKQLFQPLNPDSKIVFSARIVALGDEVKPPKKGQLQLTVGMILPKGQEIVKPAVSQVVIDKYLKKQGADPSKKTIAIGEKVQAEFSPAKF